MKNIFYRDFYFFDDRNTILNHLAKHYVEKLTSSPTNPSDSLPDLLTVYREWNGHADEGRQR